MKKVACSVVAAMVGSFLSIATAADSESGTKLILEAQDLGTFGTFKYDKSEIAVSKTYANPKGLVELTLGGAPVSFGAELAQSKNTFDGTYEDSHGSVDVKRSEIVGFLRFGQKDNSNIRLGFRKFKYDFSNANIFQDNGEEDRNGTATGDLTTGADLEATLAIGSDVQFALTVGGTYFKSAKYSWEYDKYVNGRSAGHQTGSATLDAYSARVRPQISVKVSDNVRLFVNGTLAASTWNAKPDGDPSYPGVDIYMAAGAGVQVTFGL